MITLEITLNFTVDLSPEYYLVLKKANKNGPAWSSELNVDLANRLYTNDLLKRRPSSLGSNANYEYRITQLGRKMLAEYHSIVHGQSKSVLSVCGE